MLQDRKRPPHFRVQFHLLIDSNIKSPHVYIFIGFNDHLISFDEVGSDENYMMTRHANTEIALGGL